MLKRIAQSPYLNFLSGMILLLTAAYETWWSFGEVQIGVHHGVLVFSLIHLVRTFPDVMEALQEINEAGEAVKGKSVS